MYNLNVNLAETAAHAANTLLVETEGPTPRTPEILNSVIAMTNPMDSYAYGCQKSAKNGVFANHHHHQSQSSDSNSSSSSQLESPTTNPPSVQHTCSQLIKAGLKLSIEQKRKHHQSEGDDFFDLDRCKRIKRNECSESEDDKLRIDSGLTPEDEERRKRRRERNKIAATKCRQKKRERTQNLVSESETLQKQHDDLREQIRLLEQQRSGLESSLREHRLLCQHNIKQPTRNSLHRLPPVSSVMDTHSYSRPPSMDTSFNFDQGMMNTNNGYNNNLYGYHRPPTIVVDDVDNHHQHHLTEMDLHNHNSNYYHGYAGNQVYGSGVDNGCMA